MTDPRQALEDAREHRAFAALESTLAAADLQTAIVRANKAGISKTEIAELAGVSRQTVHSMLKTGRGSS